VPRSVFQLKDEPEGTEKARIVMAPLWVDLWKESSRSRKVFDFDFDFGFDFGFGFGFGFVFGSGLSRGMEREARGRRLSLLASLRD
jgi:hypothetical protein